MHYAMCVCSSMMSVVISAVFQFYLDGKVIVINFNTNVYYSLVYNHGSALNPDRFIRMIWNSPWYLGLLLLSGWYHHAWYILCTNAVIKDELCVLPSLVGVACSPIYQWAMEGWVMDPFPWCCSSGEAVSMRYSYWQTFTSSSEQRWFTCTKILIGQVRH